MTMVSSLHESFIRALTIISVILSVNNITSRNTFAMSSDVINTTNPETTLTPEMSSADVPGINNSINASSTTDTPVNISSVTLDLNNSTTFTSSSSSEPVTSASTSTVSSQPVTSPATIGCTFIVSSHTVTSKTSTIHETTAPSDTVTSTTSTGPTTTVLSQPVTSTTSTSSASTVSSDMVTSTTSTSATTTVLSQPVTSTTSTSSTSTVSFQLVTSTTYDCSSSVSDSLYVVDSPISINPTTTVLSQPVTSTTSTSSSSTVSSKPATSTTSGSYSSTVSSQPVTSTTSTNSTSTASLHMVHSTTSTSLNTTVLLQAVTSTTSSSSTSAVLLQTITSTTSNSSTSTVSLQPVTSTTSSTSTSTAPSDTVTSTTSTGPTTTAYTSSTSTVSSQPVTSTAYISSTPTDVDSTFSHTVTSTTSTSATTTVLSQPVTSTTSSTSASTVVLQPATSTTSSTSTSTVSSDMVTSTTSTGPTTTVLSQPVTSATSTSSTSTVLLQPATSTTSSTSTSTGLTLTPLELYKTTGRCVDLLDSIENMAAEVLPLTNVTSILNAVLNASEMFLDSSSTDPNKLVSTGNRLLKASEKLVSMLVKPTNTMDNVSFTLDSLEVEVFMVGPNVTLEKIPLLDTTNASVNIDLIGIAKNNNETRSAAVAFMSYTMMENLLKPDFFNTSNDKIKTMLSTVISATLPKTTNTKLTEPVNFTLKHIREFDPSGSLSCVYWNISEWIVDGCSVLETNSSFTVCSCVHLSTFALIMQTSRPPERDSLMELLNMVCVIVGLVFFSLALLTFALCQWSPGVNNVARINICISLLLAHLLLLLTQQFLKLIRPQQVLCAVIAGLLHFLFLSAFVWMFIEAVLLFIRVKNLSQISSINKEVLSSGFLCVIGYVVALSVVTVSGVVDPKDYGNEECWIERNAIISKFLGPLCMILMSNTILFIKILINLYSTLKNLNAEVSQMKQTKIMVFKTLAQFVVLGCSWILGFFTNGSKVLEILFLILNSQQGTFIFLIYCVLNKEVRQQYRKFFRSLWCVKQQDYNIMIRK
ncbi:mucin-5AC-like isoform X3 [Puntigrus tetrazona]|uniref:mucin-5AC-like isoform X3 n=1 Tax=Puntigrus tetrazona TaxID=1606681 RepID=UPI001C8A4ED3|nr:mucin-5AC-like isoform X3 [Puntigrus tetrazona]